MSRKIPYFFALLFTALALSPALAHLFELCNKINLSPDEYLTVQRLYRGWAALGIVEAGALLSTAVLAVIIRRRQKSRILVLIPLLCILGALAVFFAFTYPANQQTFNWTVLPPNWQEVRSRWEYSHAVRACLYLSALITLILSVLAGDE